jgi:hypothetical protein
MRRARSVPHTPLRTALVLLNRSSIKTKTWDVRVPVGRSRPRGQIGALVQLYISANTGIGYSCIARLYAELCFRG